MTSEGQPVKCSTLMGSRRSSRARTPAASGLEQAHERHGQSSSSMYGVPESGKVTFGRFQKNAAWLASQRLDGGQHMAMRAEPLSSLVHLESTPDHRQTFSASTLTPAPVVCDRQDTPAPTTAAHGPRPRAPSASRQPETTTMAPVQEHGNRHRGRYRRASGMPPRVDACLWGTAGRTTRSWAREEPSIMPNSKFYMLRNTNMARWHRCAR